MEKIRVSLQLGNGFIASLLKKEIKGLDNLYLYNYPDNADIVLIDKLFLFKEVEKAESFVEKNKHLVFINYDLDEEEIAILLKLIPIRGVIDKDMRLELMRRMFVSIMNGDIWIKRSIINFLLKKVFPLDSLSDKELLIINYLLEGYANKEIASKLNLSEQSIKYYVNQLFKKLNCSSRVEIIIKLMKFKPYIQLLLKQKERICTG
ncbi:helix-turn-helix domain-containing protein [Thermovibrio sp.]